MDFLKSCATNVRVVENLAFVPCQTFVVDDDGTFTEHHSQFCQAIATLRQGNILCTRNGQHLIVFGFKLEETMASLRQIGYREIEVDEVQKERTLLDAVEGSLAYRLATDGLVHVAPWTWIFPADSALAACTGDQSVVIQLHPTMSANGALYMSTSIRHSTLSPRVSRAASSESTTCLLAPRGISARLVTTSEHGSIGHGDSTWKASIMESLQPEGLRLSDDEAWLDLEVEMGQVPLRFVWPERLCFVSEDPDGLTLMSDSSDWSYWFGTSVVDSDVFQEPFATSELWALNPEQRQATYEEDAPTGNDDGLLPLPADAAADSVTSPPFNQRAADQQAAMSGIYPTPPDGLLPGTQGTQQVSTSESNTMPPITESSELLPGEDMDGLRQSISSSNAAEAGFHRSDDDLFGDMGEIDFGGNEVGDADFDYFDEPDEEPVDGLVDRTAAADVDMADADTPHTFADAQHFLATASSRKETLIAEVEQLSTAREEDAEAIAATVTPTPDSDAAARAAELLQHDIVPQQPGRPLSPFGIRERLLPPPIPASAVRAEAEKTGNLRRTSTFGPVTFQEGLGLGSKYQTDHLASLAQGSRKQSSDVDISLPPRQKKPRPKPPLSDVDSEASDTELKTSESDPSESETSVSDAEPPWKLPWKTRKRKRAADGTGKNAEHAPDFPWMRKDKDEDAEKSATNVERLRRLHDLLLKSNNVLEPTAARNEKAGPASDMPLTGRTGSPDKGTPLTDLFPKLEDIELVYIAQIVSEQSLSVASHLLAVVRLKPTPLCDDDDAAGAIYPLLDQALGSFCPTASACDLGKLALPREPTRQVPSSSGKGPHAVPRPPQRADSAQQGPDCCPIPPPYIRAQRCGDAVELLPPAVAFWSTLGLSPAHGSKDIRVCNVVPDNLDLVRSVTDFVNELKLVYEANKMGSWKHVSGLSTDDLKQLTMHDDSTVLVRPIEAEDVVNIATVFRAYAYSCEQLGKALAHIGHQEPDSTIIVSIVSPFSGSRAQQYLCACFWMLYKAYRDNTPKATRSAPRSDIVLRILPCDLVASDDGLVTLTQQQLSLLAMEIYDRCPPSSKAAASKDLPAALMPYFAAPAVELALPIPRRIPFQLASDPPGDLLHENSALHLAYATTDDRKWMCFSWIDSSGRFQSQLSACLRGKSIVDVVSEAWERTCDWLRVKDITWRVYVVSCERADKSVDDCWRSVVSSKPRRQPLHVTLLSVQRDPELKLKPPPPQTPAGAGEKGGQGFLTPVTTPSGTSLTVSPDASTVAPPTPAPTDPAPDNDVDAYLVDIADESWGVMLSPTLKPASVSTASQVLASGMLFRRGDAASNTSSRSSELALESLGVTLHWDVRVRPNGTVDEGPIRQAEFTLREVLRAFRNLALLGRARGESKGGAVPVHVLGAAKGAEALNGMIE